MIFAQLTYRESLRDIQACLGAIRSKLYDMGFRGIVLKSTLADANDAHDWRIYADFAQVLIAIAGPLCANESMGVELDQEPLRAGFFDHRLMPEPVFVGEFSAP